MPKNKKQKENQNPHIIFQGQETLQCATNC